LIQTTLFDAQWAARRDNIAHQTAGATHRERLLSVFFGAEALGTALLLQ